MAGDFLDPNFNPKSISLACGMGSVRPYTVRFVTFKILTDILSESTKNRSTSLFQPGCSVNHKAPSFGPAGTIPLRTATYRTIKLVTLVDSSLSENHCLLFGLFLYTEQTGLS
jgi:hypothetical protein